jgi:hypothetical protein
MHQQKASRTSRRCWVWRTSMHGMEVRSGRGWEPIGKPDDADFRGPDHRERAA